MSLPDTLRRRVADAQADALRVHDSPQRADRVALQVAQLAHALRIAPDVVDETRARVGAALADAERVLRRDDDGREAARHLQIALTLAGERPPRAPSPFGDD